MESLEDRLLLDGSPAVQILDDGDAGFSTAGAWSPFVGQGYQNDLTYAAPGSAFSATELGTPVAAIVGAPPASGRISDAEALRRDGIVQ